MKINNNKLTLALCVSLALSACSPNKTTEEYITSANMLLNSKNTNAAIIELKNAIKADPNSALARYTLGQIYLDQGDFLSAIKELKKANQNIELSNKVVPLLAQAYQKSGKEYELLDLEESSNDLNDASKLQLAVFTSIYYSQKNDVENARKYLSIATSLSEDNVYSQLANAWLKKSEKQIDDAITIVTKLSNESTELSELKLLQGHLFSAKGEFAKAAQSYQEYSLAHPKQYQVKMFLANSLLAAGENDKADEELNTLLKLFPKHPFVNQLKSQLSYTQGNYESAKQFANVALQSVGMPMPMAKLILGLSAYQLKEYEQAYQSLRTVVSDLPNNHPVHELLLSLQLQLGYSSEAAKSFQDLNKFISGDEKLLQNTSLAFSRAGNDKVANELVDKALELSPNNADLMMQKGMLKLKEQDSAGFALLEKSLLLNPELKTANITLAMQYVTERKYDKALEIAKKWQQSKSGNIQGKLLEGVIYTAQFNLSKAKEIFNQVLKIDDNNVPANYYVGQLELNDKNYDQALVQFEKVLKQSPAHFGALQYIIWTALASSNQDKVNEFFVKLRKEFPQKLSLILAQSLNIATQGNIPKAIDFLNKYRDSDIVNQDYWFALADLYKQNNQLDESKEIYKKLLVDNPKSMNARLSLLANYALEKNYLAIIAEVNEALALAPNNLKLKVIKSKYLLKSNQLDSAYLLLIELEKSLPENVDVKRMQADYEFRKGNYKQAVIILDEVYAKNKSEHHLMEYVKALKAVNQNDKAINELGEFLKNSKDKHIMAKAAYAQLLLVNNPNKALLQYYNLLEDMPDNVILLNNTALAELSLNFIDKAMQHAKKAVTLAPKKAALIDTYAQVLMEDKQFEQANKNFEIAHKLAKTNDEIFIHFAQSLAKLGKLNQLKLLISQYSLKSDKYESELQQLNNLIK